MKKNFTLFTWIMLITSMSLLKSGQINAQIWFDTDWQFRRPISIINQGSVALSDFQVKITLDNSFDFNKTNSDGSDIRLTDEDGITLIPFWIETWDITGEQAIIWVKIPSIPVSGTTAFLYYGNGTATNESNGTTTFQFFDDFTNGDVSYGRWIRILNYPWGTAGHTVHDWKYSMEMQQGALYFSLNKAQNGWNIESLDTQIQQEFDYLNSQILSNGTVIGGISSEPQYCYGVLLSNLSLGYLYFKSSDPVLAERCYTDMLKVYGYVRDTYQNTIGLADAGGSSMALAGLSNAWKAFTDYGNTTSANEVSAIVQNYANTFITNQTVSGSWNGANGIQEHEKRDFGVLLAYDVTGNYAYLTAVKNNIDYILTTFWLPSNGGLTWHGSVSEPFYECHQQWFMIAVKMLYNKSGGAYDYLAQGQQAWHFLTDNNYAGIDTYVHNYLNNGAFFSYRNLSSNGTFNLDGWKGSYEIGSALWGMSLNYDWVSDYQSSHSDQSYNYLDELVIQIKESPVNKGFFESSGSPVSTLWSKIGNPNVSIVEDDGNNVLSAIGPNTHFAYLVSNDKSFTDFILETKVKITYDVNNSCTPEISFRYTDNNNNYMTMLRGESLNDLFLRKYYNGGQALNATTSYNYTANQYYNYKVSANGNTVVLYLNDNPVLSPVNSGGDVLTGGIGLGNYGDNSHPVYYDDVRIRNFAASEPTTIVGGEQGQNPSLIIAFTKTDVSCYGGTDGAIDITVTGGSGTYSYFWSPGGQTTEDISGLTAGTYYVFVEDGAGSSGSETIILTQPTPVELSYSITYPVNCPGSEASVLISATGGTPPYSGTGNFQQPVGTTVYNVTDANGCSESISVTVSDPAAWFDANWQYRRLVDVANPGGDNLTDFQVKITLDGTFDFSKAQTDGSDIRFTASDGVSSIPYWIKTWDNVGTDAEIWVKVPSIPASGTTIFMYYGNSEASGASDGTSTFMFFDDFSDTNLATQGNWIRILNYPWGTAGYTAHDWKYSSEMQQGALYYSIEKALHGWSTESLDSEIEQEFDYIHSRINPDGTVVADAYLSAEPQYCYGLILSNLSLGYMYFKTSDPALSTRCYNDMELVFNYLRVTYPSISSLSDAGGYGWLLVGYSNAWKAFTDHGNATSASQALTLVQNYAGIFIANQSGGSWTGVSGIQENMKRNFGILKAYDVTGSYSYLTAVKSNIDYVLSTLWISSNGGLAWHGLPTSEPFYECHQQWFMIAVRMLYDKSGGTYDYLSQGLQAWHFLTDNNYANIDVYVHNYVNNGAFFSYRNLSNTGAYNLDSWKGSYEVGTALWGMSLNYDWVNNYQSSHSSQAYNYLDMFVKQIKNQPSSKGYFLTGATSLNNDLWTTVGSPAVSIIQDEGNNVLSIKGNGSHNDLITTVDKNFDNFIFESKVKMTYDGNEYCNPEVDFRYSDLNNRYFAQMRGESQNDLFMRRYQGGTQYVNYASVFNYSSDIYYQFKISAKEDDIKLFLDENLITDYNDAGTGILSGGFSLHNYRSNNPAYFDDVRVRKYAEIEPLSFVGTESRNILLNDLKVYLEGSFTESAMSTNLNSMGLIPLDQPYDTEPWNYPCPDNVTEIPNSNVVDWVLVELRDSPDAASANSATTIAQKAAFLLNDGRIVDLDGASGLTFQISINHQLFVVVYHRNHLGIISANPLTIEPGGLCAYDFTTNASQAYGNGQVFLGNSYFGMIAGDANSDGIIDLSDKILTWKPQSGSNGYLNGDLNLDGDANNPDKNDYWLKNLDFETQIPE